MMTDPTRPLAPIEETVALMDRRDEIARQVELMHWQLAQLAAEDQACQDRMRALVPVLPPEPEWVIAHIRQVREHHALR
jgi:hypothetical protein